MTLGDYVVMERIAVGGMAEVFRAERRVPGRGLESVVIKRMLPALAAEAAAREMMRDEARLGGLVRHEGVVRVLGHGEEAGQPYLVLEHVPGVDLWRLGRALTREGKSLGVGLAAYVATCLCRALHAVHEATDERGAPLGLVHRDVSPSNVLLGVDGRVKLADFGIAQADVSRALASTAMLARAKGKLGYLSPEQVRGEPTDRRADVFAAAVIAAELLVGKPLFAGGSELAILLAIRDAQIRPLEESAHALPAELYGAVTRALAVEPDDRTPTAAALADALAPFATAPETRARAELGALVMPIAGTSVSGTFRAVREATPLDRESVGAAPVTAETPVILYRVRTSGGHILGPLSYAKVVEAIATREIGVADLVAIGSGAFSPITAHADLQRHFPASSLSETTRDQGTTTRPDREHDLGPRGDGIARAIGQIMLARDSGLLLVSRGATRKELYFQKGIPEFVTSNVPSELLGEFLVARGVISRGELDMALAVMPRFEGRLGDTLTALGLVESVYLFREIAAQVLEKLLELFTWDDGHALFFRDVAPPPSGFPLGLDPYRVLQQGLERRFAAGLDRDRLAGRGGERLVPVRPAPLGLRHATLPLSARRCLERIDRPRPLAEIVAELRDRTGRDPLAGLREVALLLALGAVAIEPT